LRDGGLTRLLSGVQRRWRIRTIAHAIAIAGVVFALSMLGVFALGGGRDVAAAVGIVAALMTATAVVRRTPTMSLIGAARAIERGNRAFENLLVTAAELTERPRPVDPGVQAEILRLASERASGVSAVGAVPLSQPVMVATAVLAGCALLISASGASLPMVIAGGSRGLQAVLQAGAFEVRVTPPAYSKRPAEVMQNPVQISVLAGSRVQIAAINRDWIAKQSEAIEVRTSPEAEARFLSVAVVPDLSPTIRIVTPGKDSAFAQPAGRIPVAIHSGDDLAMASLSLRFTKASGGGENVSFSEGELPLRIERVNDREWRARAEFVLDALNLADGDILVYRAVARDSNPNGAAVLSDQFVIEIGKNAEIANAGFALPAEEKKYAISQQMVIYRTEQLIKARPGDFLDQSKGIAVEQRMVRAEVVFLGGGEVQDEVEEAAHSHELAEGRLENSGRAEMLRAINAMSRAEAELNDGRAAEALVLERLALMHLERALDRRRYFLRTLPDRSRIDATRRLTGERREARSWERDASTAAAPTTLEALRGVMRDLAAGAEVNATLAARVGAVDPASPDLQKAAVALASASTAAARAAASQDAMAALTRHALQAMPGGRAIDLATPPLAGALSAELSAVARPRQ
jgi:hypothetical protein